MNTMTTPHATRVMRPRLFVLLLLAGLFSMPNAYAVNCSTSYFCYKTMTPQANTRMPVSKPRRQASPNSAAVQAQRNTNNRVAQQQNRRAQAQRPNQRANQRPPQTRNTPPRLRPTAPNNNRRPAVANNNQRCLDSRAALMKRAKAVESQAITQAKQRNQTNAARLFRTAEKMRKDAQNMRCR